jgi:hypothetical protein
MYRDDEKRVRNFYRETSMVSCDRRRSKLGDSNKMDAEEIRCEGEEWSKLHQDRFLKTEMNFTVLYTWGIS